VPQPFTTHLDTLQRRIGQELFARVAGPEGPANRERFRKSGPRWFTDDRPIRRVHGDAAMFVGGLRALLLQSLHPLAMIAVAQHSDYREDPWGRLQRTSTFLAATTYGTVEDAQRAVDRVRRVHEHVTGIAPDGRPYRAADPHLLRWVHVAETDSFLRCHQRYGARPLDAAGCDGYVADTARIAIELGVPDPPRSRADLDAALRAYRPELRGSAEAREAARFLVRNPPLPLLARGPYALLAAAAVGELPAWARRELRLPGITGTDSLLVRPAGHAIVGTVRWVMRARSLPAYGALPLRARCTASATTGWSRPFPCRLTTSESLASHLYQIELSCGICPGLRRQIPHDLWSSRPGARRGWRELGLGLVRRGGRGGPRLGRPARPGRPGPGCRGRSSRR